MFTVIVILISGFLSLSCAQNVDVKFYDQKLDHVAANDTTWRQRYLENREFFQPGGPIFLQLGGPRYSSASPSLLQNGSAMVTYAKEQGANLMLLEARYYGRSRPTDDLSTENLRRYFSFQQSVEDLEGFARWLKTQPEFANSKIVGFGSGVLGSRVAAAMKKATRSLDYAVLSSAPVEIKYEVPEYAEKLVEVMNQTDPECFESLHDTLLCFPKLARGERCQGHVVADLREMFNLCGDIDPQNPNDLVDLLVLVLRNVAQVVFTNNPDPSSPYNVDKMCASLSNTSTNLTRMERLAIEIQQIEKITNLPCLEVRFSHLVGLLSNPAWDQPGTLAGERQAMWLRCSEGAMIRTPTALQLEDNGQFVITFISTICQTVFNISAEQVQRNTMISNALQGNRSLPSECSIYVSGSEDLFLSVGVKSQEEVGSCNRAFLIPGASFAKNAGPIRDDMTISYPPALRMTQLEVGAVLKDWLSRPGGRDCCLPATQGLELTPPEIFDLF